MKQYQKRLLPLLALLLVLGCLMPDGLSLRVFSAPKAADYVYPNDWSRPALIFAVENGILMGDANRDLKPAANITRAETAAVMVRLLAVTKQSDLSRYSDVSTADWFYRELSYAVAAGLFSGISDTRMEPNAPITREQILVVLCRAFGIVPKGSEGYKGFTDGASVSPYAREAVSAMRDRGLVQGYKDGSLKPQAPITRAETAQLLYNLFDVIADHPSRIPTKGRVLYRGKEPLPPVLKLEGSLFLSQGTAKALTVEDWQIRDSLVLRMAEGATAYLNGLTCEELVLCSSGSFRAQVSTLWLANEHSEFTGNAQHLGVLSGTHKAVGEYGKVRISQNTAVTVEGSVSELTAERSSKTVLKGNCTTAHLAPYARLTLEGDLDSLTMEANSALELKGAVGSITVNGANVSLSGEGKAQTVTVYEEGVQISIEVEQLQNIWEENYRKEHDRALETVKTQVVPVKVLSDVRLYRNQNLTDYLLTVPGGVTVANEWNPTGPVMRVTYTDENGRKWTGWAERWAFSIQSKTVTTDFSLDYSKATKEGYVNLSGYESNTEYLIWVSRYTQKVIVYQGQKGNWKVIKTMPCATGANSCPTPTGQYDLTAHRTVWDFDTYLVYKVTVYNGPFAFHTVTYKPNGSLLDGRVGQPLSHGCVRMLYEDSSYIYDLPLGTHVVIY